MNKLAGYILAYREPAIVLTVAAIAVVLACMVVPLISGGH